MFENNLACIIESLKILVTVIGFDGEYMTILNQYSQRLTNRVKNIKLVVVNNRN